ncbi:MAG: glycosyltransferase family 47 protein, partial [Anaerolineales bacterium]|nr:glycosyltransferase family 47 protein [Anaerolineales bacterium]
VFGCAGYQSRAGSRRFGTPVFIRDPLREHGFEHIQPLARPPKPLIGFCGYARTMPIKAAAFTLTTLRRNLFSALRLTAEEPQTLFPPVLLRQRLLERLSRSPLVETDFIQNAHYQAGARTAQSKAEAQARFFHNIRSTAYTLCVRGSGNFSVRLYETLAMGRIPVLVDTDCLLPYARDPRWKTCCVYVPQAETARIAEIVAAFHVQLSAADFIEIQHQARWFWEERLSMDGFFTHFPEHIH